MSFILIFSGGLLSGLCTSPPSIPTSFSGKVFCEGGNLPGNFPINAYLNGYGSLGTVGNGEYSIDVSSCGESSSGTVSFFINGIEADEHPEYDGQEDWGKSFDLDLTFETCPVSEENYCGDKIKGSGEVCDESDFGALSCSNYGFDSGTLRCSDSCINIYIDGCYMNSPTPPADNPPADSPGGSPGSGGGGGSSTSNDGTIHIISVTQISSGVTKDMGVKDQMKFQIENVQHTLSLNYVDSTSASVTVQSNPLTFVLEIGQEKKIDFELDGFYDLVVKLEEIVNNKATINVQSIYEEVIEEDDTLGDTEQETEDTESEDSQSFFGTMTGAVIGNLKTKGGIATVFVLVVVIGGALAIFITRKKKLQKIK